MPPRGDAQLAIGYWLVSHKETLRKWWAISLMAFISLSFLWGLIFTIIFFSQSGGVNQRLNQSLQGIGQLSNASHHGPTALSVSTATVIARDANHVDLVAMVTNPNADWGAPTVSAHFVVAGKVQPTQTIFLNPSAKRPVVLLNIAVDQASTATAQLIIDETTWAKTATAALPAADFSMDNVTLTPTTVTVHGLAISTVSLNAAVTNRSVYNFRHVIVPIVLMAGETIVAVDQVTTDAWPTLTSKTITSTWAYPVSGNVTATLSPDVSQFDQGNVYR